MASRVFLHIGVPKTGTTYLQELMHRNRPALEKVGVRYADGRFPNDRVWASEVLRGFTMRTRPARAAGAWDRILRQIVDWPGTAVFSHEFLSVCSEEQAQRALRDLASTEVHVVLTARDYVRQMAAVWQERLKYGYDRPFSSFSLDNDKPAWSWRSQDVPAILERWCRGMDPERVHVVTVPTGSAPPDELWHRFASVIGAESAATDGVPSTNSSLGLVETELLRRVNRRLRQHDLLRRPRIVRDFFANSILSQGSNERFTVSSERWQELHVRAEATVANITRAGYHVVGSVDDLLPPPRSDGGRAPEEATDAELLEAALETIAALLAHQHGEGTQRRRRRPDPGLDGHEAAGPATQEKPAETRAAAPAEGSEQDSAVG